MPDIETLNAGSTVRDVVDATLRAVMPDGIGDPEIADLVDAVMSDPLVKRHEGKLWLDVSRNEASMITRVTGEVAARAALRG